LKKARPDAEFYSMGSAKICMNMKKTSLMDVLKAIRDEKIEVVLDKEIIEKAIIPINRMVAL
jgi:quinolinate synthase